MWKLTIKQKRKSEYSNNMITESVEFVSKDITYLTSMIDRLSDAGTDVETAYEIKKVGVENE